MKGGRNGELTQAPKRRKNKAAARRRGQDLLHWNNLPDYLKDNEFIYTGYRADTGLGGSLRSLFRLHNESGNIWTHLIGFIFFVFLLVSIIGRPPTPIALSKADADHMWDVMTDRLGNTSSATIDQIRQLQASMHAQLDENFPCDLFQDARTGFRLRGGFAESLHMLEGRVHHLSLSISEGMHAVGYVFTHPKELRTSLSNLTSHLPHLSDLPHDITEGFRVLRKGVPRTLRSLRNEVRSFDISSVPLVLDMWLHDVVRRAVMWPVPRWPVYVFMAGAMSCLLLSAVCHLLGCCNRHISLTIWRFDYAGIVANIVSSFFPSVYYVFLCMPWPRWSYLTGITFFGIVTLALSTLERFQTVHWRSTRAACFAVLGLFGTFPWGHVLVAYPYSESVWRALVLDACMGLSYMFGALFYAMRIPERWFPGRFDLFLHSHQIFHMFVVLGAYLHYLGTLELLHWRDASGGCALEITDYASVYAATGARDGLMDVEGLLRSLRHRLWALWHLHGDSGSPRGLHAALTADGYDVSSQGFCPWVS